VTGAKTNSSKTYLQNTILNFWTALAVFCLQNDHNKLLRKKTEKVPTKAEFHANLKTVEV
jgi:hypothetical protein